MHGAFNKQKSTVGAETEIRKPVDGVYLLHLIKETVQRAISSDFNNSHILSPISTKLCTGNARWTFVHPPTQREKRKLGNS